MPPNQMLDAIVLATMPAKAQLKRIAAYWRAAHGSRAPYTKTEAGKWVQQEFGGLWGSGERDRRAKELVDEIEEQVRRRDRRDRKKLILDPLTTPTGSDERMAKLLVSRLGPARRWAGRHQTTDGASYIAGDVYSGLVCGLIPLRMNFRRIADPNLLVYRYRWQEPRTKYVPTYVTTITDAFTWLVPDEAREFLTLPGVRVEHDADHQVVHLITEWGTKELPWRDLSQVWGR